MVSRCCNPACNCVFRELSKGRLFLLPPAHFHSDSIKLSDYCYWLCPRVRRSLYGHAVRTRDCSG